jgi:glutaredoxin 3
MKQVKIYTSPICGYCLAAKRLLSSLGVSYEEIGLWDQPDLVHELQEKYQWQTVPMIFIDDEFVGGYDDISTLHRQGLLTKKLGL